MIMIKVYQCVNKVVDQGCPCSAVCVPKKKQVVGKCTSSTQAGHLTCLILCTVLGYIVHFLAVAKFVHSWCLHLGHPLSTHVNKPVSKLATIGLTAVAIIAMLYTHLIGRIN